MPKKKEEWICEKCGQIYPALDEAKWCEENHLFPTKVIEAQYEKNELLPEKLVVSVKVGDEECKAYYERVKAGLNSAVWQKVRKFKESNSLAELRYKQQLEALRKSNQ